MLSFTTLVDCWVKPGNFGTLHQSVRYRKRLVRTIKETPCPDRDKMPHNNCLRIKMAIAYESYPFLFYHFLAWELVGPVPSERLAGIRYSFPEQNASTQRSWLVFLQSRPEVSIVTHDWDLNIATTLR